MMIWHGCGCGSGDSLIKDGDATSYFVPDCGVRPLRLVILSRRAEPPSLIFASRRSRRNRADRCAGDSSDIFVEPSREDIELSLRWNAAIWKFWTLAIAGGMLFGECGVLDVCRSVVWGCRFCGNNTSHITACWHNVHNSTTTVYVPELSIRFT